MAFYIDENQEVYAYRMAGRNSIRLDDGRVIDDPESRRLFATHPDQNAFCNKRNGVWYYQGEPIDKSRRLDERAWVDGHGLIMVPDTKLEPQPSYTYRPMRGYSGSVAAEDGSGEVIGWVSIDDLGYPAPQTVRDWMHDTKYVIQGDGWAEA